MRLGGFCKYQIKKDISHLTISQKSLKRYIWVVKMVHPQDLLYIQNDNYSSKAEINMIIDKQIEYEQRLQKLEKTVLRLKSQETI